LDRFYVYFIFFILSGCALVTDSVDHPRERGSAEQMELFYNGVDAVKVYPEGKKNNSVRGICVVNPTLLDFANTPCNKVTFILVNSDGNEVSRQTTGENGEFSFSVEKRGPYIVKIISDRYEMVTEKLIVTKGTDVLVRLIKGKESKGE